MSKEAILFTIDAGNSMEQRFAHSEQSRFKISMECLQLFLQQKIFNNSSHQIGLSLFGEDENQDGNNLTLQKIDRPNLDFVRKIVKLSQIKLGNSKEGGDLFSAIRYTISTLMEHGAKKKYNKRGFVFTNGAGMTECKTRDLKEMAKDLQIHEIKLNIIPIDFMVTYDIQNNSLSGENFMSEAKQKNANLLMELRSLQSQNVQIFPAGIAIDLYRTFRKRDVNPVARYKGKFQIAPNLAIDVVSYKAIRKQRLKSLSKYDKMAPYDPIVPKEKEIILDVSYIIGGQTNDTEVIPPQNTVNAFHYGCNLVPMNDLVQKITKIYEQKNLTLLGFVHKDKIPRECFLGEVDIVVPQEGDIGKRLFSAFIQSMISLKKYAVARYVPRNSKNGVNPQMVALIPYHSPERQMFYMIEIPTIQGVRDYQYNSLKTPTSQQRNCVKELVQKMLLFSTNQDGQQEEQVRPETTFNPYRQYFYQTLFHRALYQQNEIPQLDSVIRNYITPEARKFDQCSNLMQKLKAQFKFKVKELKKDKENDKKIVQWIDLIKTQNEMSEESTNLQEIVMTSKKFEFNSLDDDEFSYVTPIVSFKKMITNNKKDLVEKALTQMSKYIFIKVKQNNSDLIPHIIECCQAMKGACISQKEQQFWDNWLGQVQVQNNDLCTLLKKNGFGYINRSNQVIFSFNQKILNVYQSQVDDLD